MKHFFITALACAATLLACACNGNKPEPEPTPTPEPEPTPAFSLDSFNGRYLEALAGAYDVFENTGSLPATINIEGIKHTKGQYTVAACMLVGKIAADPKTWQDEDIDPFVPAFGGDYRWNTYDPDEIDWQHIKYMASRILAYAQDKKSLPNYVTFPSSDETSEGYMPQLTMIVTKHDNMMNLNAYMVVLTRALKYVKENEGKTPEKVSSWPATYLDAVRNCPKDDPLVKSTLDAALKKKNLGADATARQKAEAIFEYARDEWEWEDYANTRKGALGTINAKGGNCCDLTHATIAMCRAAGIPARYLHGQCYFTSGVIGHLIPEIYVDGKWWVCDPSNNNATFGTPTWKGMETFNGRYNELEF